MNESHKNPEEVVEILRRLAQEDIARLEKLPQPIIRVIGPWTTGGFGYEENIKRFAKAETVLKEKGYTIVDYFESEKTIKQLREDGVLDPNVTMIEYHNPILESGYIKKAFVMPRSNESAGATHEINFIREHTNIELEDIPEEWLQ